jgi:putative ABC transport system substrate-binding protein
MMSYGAYFPALFARSAEMVDKILKGASAGDIPVEQASRLELVINMRTVDAIGASIPRILLTYANEILE